MAPIRLAPVLVLIRDAPVYITKRSYSILVVFY